MNNKLVVNISILIVTYNNESTITDCIDSLFSQRFEGFDILIRDNCSSDATLEILEKYKNIRIFPASRNEGFGAGMNFLSQKARGEYLFMLNPDCIVPDNTLNNLIEFARNYPGVISPSLQYPDGTFQPSARHLLSYKNILFSRRSPVYQLGLVDISDAGYILLSQPGKVPAVSATALFMKKELFTRAGGFDKRYFLYLEDIDLCYRLSEINVDIWYLPDMKIQHVLGASSKKSSARALYHHHISMYKYFTKHFPKNYIKNSLLLALLLLGLAGSLILRIFKPDRRK